MLGQDGGGGVVDLETHPYYMCYRAWFGLYKSNRMGVGRFHIKIHNARARYATRRWWV